MEWPTPDKSPRSVHSFMVLVGYYQRFVEGFSMIENWITEVAKEE
jgi:hypothetical protein